MKSLNTIIIKALLLISMLIMSLVIYAEHNELDTLLELVKQGLTQDAKEQENRIAKFKRNQAKQAALLQQALIEKTDLENKSLNLENLFAENEVALLKAQNKLTERLGSLKELFFVLQDSVSDTKSIFDNSVLSSQFPNRSDFLNELKKNASSNSRLPSISELEQLWYEMQREMVHSGRVEKYTSRLTKLDGKKVNAEVVRIGSFNVIKNGEFLAWDDSTATLVELVRQPASRYLSGLNSLESSKDQSNLNDIWLDPSRGGLIDMLLQKATFSEKVSMGGSVGYLILALGLLALSLASYRYIVLTVMSRKIAKQTRSTIAKDDNPLGRVMNAYKISCNTDTETLELHLSEAIAKEVPGVTNSISLIKTISVVAPLLGLLGTVIGMINVFETLALFGTGDPKLMSGGISQALVTTVEGLFVAIPIVLFHAVLNERSKNIILVLEERAMGLMARHIESHHNKPAR